MTRKIVRKLLHKDYQPFDDRVPKTEADVGLFIMETPVQYTNYIQPICLPSRTENVYDISGVVVGYGIPQVHSKPRNLPQFATMSSVSLLKCLYSDFNSLHTVSQRSFCAYGIDGSPCAGEFI